MTGAMDQAEDSHLWKGLEPKVIYLSEYSHLKGMSITSPGNCVVVGICPKVQRKKIYLISTLLQGPICNQVCAGGAEEIYHTFRFSKRAF